MPYAPLLNSGEIGAAFFKKFGKKREADELLRDERLNEGSSSVGQRDFHARAKSRDHVRQQGFEAANRDAHSTGGPATAVTQKSAKGSEVFMQDHSVVALLNILSSRSVDVDALTSQVAIFGVLQHAHASATTGDEFGLVYVRMFLEQLASHTTDHAKIARITAVLKQRLQQQCDRVRSQILSLGETAPSTATDTHTRRPATETAAHRPIPKPVSMSKHYIGSELVPVAKRRKTQQPATSSCSEHEDATSEEASPMPIGHVARAAKGPDSPVTSQEMSSLESFDPFKLMSMNGEKRKSSSANGQKFQQPDIAGSTITTPAHVVDPQRASSTTKTALVANSAPLEKQVAITPSPYFGRVVVDGKRYSASSMADIRNYAEPGEDLDWTKLTDPSERKRLQNIIGGRKYRERQLAAKGISGSGGNFPGASGAGGSVTVGYGKRTKHDVRVPQWKTAQAPPRSASSTGVGSSMNATATSTNPVRSSHGVREGRFQRDKQNPHHTHIYYPDELGHLSSVQIEISDDEEENLVSPRLPKGTMASPKASIRKAHGIQPKTPALHVDAGGDEHDKCTGNNSAGDTALQHSSDEEPEEFWTSNQPTNLSDMEEDAAVDEAPKQTNEAESNKFLELMRSHNVMSTATLERQKHYSDDRSRVKQRLNTSRSSPTSEVEYETVSTGPERNRGEQSWKPNTGDGDYFALHKPMKSPFNIFARAAHDAHYFPAKARKGGVATYHKYVRKVWKDLPEHRRYGWKALARQRDTLADVDLSVRGQRLLQTEGLLSKFLPRR